MRKGVELSTPAIEVRRLSYAYPEGTPALDAVSFEVAAGECVGLLGPNGAGKSTLLLHLNGLLPVRPPGEPSVLVEGLPLAEANLATIRRRVGFLFQDPDDQLVAPTVFDDVAFGPVQLGLNGAPLKERVEACLRQVGLEGYGRREPSRLSHGEKKRVCLAGLLACDPAVLVLDEPTAGLDPRGRRELKALLNRLPGAKVIATHDLELAVELCQRVLLIDGGRIVASGQPADLLSDEPLMLAHGLEKPHLLTHRHPHT